MPISDRREIAFDAEAMVQIVVCSEQTVRTLGLPGDRPSGARFDPRAREVILLYNVNERPTPLRSGALSALLISYCLRAGIKIPRQLERAIRVDRDAVVLIFSTSYQVSPSSLAREQVPSAKLPHRSKELAGKLA